MKVGYIVRKKSGLPFRPGGGFRSYLLARVVKINPKFPDIIGLMFGDTISYYNKEKLEVVREPGEIFRDIQWDEQPVRVPKATYKSKEEMVLHMRILNFDVSMPIMYIIV